MTAAEIVLLPSSGGAPQPGRPPPQVKSLWWTGGETGVFVSPKAHGPGTQTALWESSWQPHPPPEGLTPGGYQADEVLFRVCKSCYNHHLDDVPPFLVISPHPAHGCLLSPSFHRHQPHYSKIYNRPASSLSMLSAASIFPHRPPPPPAPVPCRLSFSQTQGGRAGHFQGSPFP